MLRLQEGPHSTLPEDEFFDAVESGLDKIEEDRQLRVRLKLQSQQQVRIHFTLLSWLHLHAHELNNLAATEKWSNCMHADCVCVCVCGAQCLCWRYANCLHCTSTRIIIIIGIAVGDIF